MAKVIKVTESLIDEAKREFESMIRSTKLSDGKLVFSKDFGKLERKAKLQFTEKAYVKMMALVQGFSSEIGWHGIASRSEDEEDTYIISDIMVYPQEVSGATVETDQEKYQMWLMSQPDEVFNNIRFQGHSHVEMGVTPSSVDLDLYKGILAQLDEDMFYIFLIINKRGERFIKIYDLKKNLCFETEDVTVSVLEEDIKLVSFMEEAEKQATRKKAAPKQTAKQAASTYPQTGYSAYNSGSDYYSYYPSAPGYSAGKSRKKNDKTGYWYLDDIDY